MTTKNTTRRLIVWIGMITALLAGVRVYVDGPLTNAMNLRMHSDASGYLIATANAYTGPDGPLTALGNMRLRTDSNGYLIVTYNGGIQTMSTVNATVAYQLNGVAGVGFALNKAQPAAPTARSSSGAFIMTGLGAAAAPCTITPTSTGRVIFSVNGDITNNTNATTVTVQMAEGTGTAPANNASATGTVISAAPVLDGLTSALTVPFSITSSVTGLVINIPVWFDLQLQTSTTNTGQPTNITCVAHEI